MGKKDTTYYIRYHQGKKVVSEKVGNHSNGMTPEKAYKILLQRREFDQRLPSNLKVLKNKKFETLNSLANKYFKQLEEIALQDQHISVYEKTSKTIKNIKKEASIYKNFWKTWSLRKIHLIKIKEEHVAKFLTEQRKNYSAKSVYNALVLARSILKHTNYTLNNPFLFNNKELHQKFQQRINSRKRFLNENEIKLLFKAAKKELSHQNYLLILTAIMTGARPNSILHLRRQDINYHKNEITFYDFKRKMHYTVPLPKKLADLFKEHEIRGYEYLFYSSISMGNKPMSEFPNAIQRLLNHMFNTNIEKHEERVVIYTFRHTFANHLLQIKKLPIQDVSHLLNHASIETTRKNYIHMINENIKNSDLSDLFD